MKCLTGYTVRSPRFPGLKLRHGDSLFDFSPETPFAQRSQAYQDYWGLFRAYPDSSQMLDVLLLGVLLAVGEMCLAV